LQAAQGASRSDQAAARAAEQNMALEAAAVRQSWGNVVAKWIVDDPPPLDRVFGQNDSLVQLTVPASAVSVAPQTVLLDLPGSGHIQEKLIPASPRVVPRIQGASFLYIAQNRHGFPPGLNLTARLPVGRLLRGVVVPRQAIVRWQGRAWVYQQTGTS